MLKICSKSRLSLRDGFAIKPMVRHLRLALRLLAMGSMMGVSGVVAAQVPIDVARVDPTPIAVKSDVLAVVDATAVKAKASTIAKSSKVLIAQLPVNPLPYCDDLPDSDLKSYVANSTIAQSNVAKGTQSDMMTMTGKACIKRAAIAVQGDVVRYDYASEQVTSTGNAVLKNAEGDVLQGQVVKYNLATQTGSAQSTQFKVNSTGGRGKAESLAILSSRRAMMEDAYYTTCRAEDPDWYIKSRTMSIDQDRDMGQTSGSVLVFKNVPILASPYMSFPLGNRRQSGFLTPSIKFSSSNGLDVSTPYYFNLAPNYDFTLTPGVMTSRGARLAAEYRYLTKYGKGNLFISDMPRDAKTQTNRYFWRGQHESSGKIAGGTWTATIDSQRASDNNYFDDFGSQKSNVDTRILPSEYAIQYAKGSWKAKLRTKSNQVLQDSTNSIGVPYDLEPQLTVTGTTRRGNWVAALDLESTKFTHTNAANAEGWRHVVYPSVRYEYRTAAGFITPKIGVNATQYNLSRVNSAYDASPSRILPVASVDSGLIFERNNASWLGQPVIQTLEPRLYYLYTPYKDQSKIWNFDSALADFDLSHIYGENIYTGRDRIAEANQATLGLTSRWLAKDTGAELFQATIAQRKYFTDQRVTLPGGVVGTNRTSDFLVSAAGQVAKHVWIDTFAQYNFDTKSLLRSDITLRYQPAAKKVINVGFHRNNVVSPTTRSVFASAQWPLGVFSKSLTGVYGVARLNYDLANKRVADGLLGIEYVKDCWVFRFVAQRTTASNTSVASNSYQVQLELKGLGALGTTDPESSMRSNISGYQGIKFVDAEEPVVVPVAAKTE